VKPKKEQHIYRIGMRRFTLYLLCSLMCVAVAKSQSNRYFNSFQDSSINRNWINANTIQADKDSASNFFSRTDAQQPYSSGLELTIPENFRKKNFRLAVNGRVRVSILGGKNQLVVTITDNDSTVYWNGLQLRDSSGSAGIWSTFKYTDVFPGNLSPSCKIKIFVWNVDGRSVTDVDDIEIIISEEPFPTFLPSLGSANASAKQLVYSNRYYNMYADEGVQKASISICSKSNDTLLKLSGLNYKHWGYQRIVFRGLTLNSKIEEAGGRTLTLLMSDTTPDFVTRVEIKMQSESEEIVFQTSVEYNVNTIVAREAIVFDAQVPVTEVYRKNTLMDTSDFQQEYWLGKEGVKFGNGNNSLVVYHNPGISSLQLSTETNQLVVNLDYDNDHPYQHFPLRKKMMDEKEYLSPGYYKAGQIRENIFSIHIGKDIQFVPRIMLNPNGYVSAHVFTEHADWTDLPTHRAVYFGSEKITDSKNATGGFIRNKIPVTKSVFYSNPDKVLNSESLHESIFTTPIASIKDTKGFPEFLEQIYKEGNEICLHTPDQYTSKRPLIEEACAYMKNHFQTVTWIDHGYNNGPKNNREAFVCDGLTSTSTSYAKDIWEKYGVEYFWNSFYEDFATDDSMFFDFYGSLMHPYPGFGDAAPQPLYWRHPTLTGNFISWPTRDLLEMHDPSMWDYHFSNERLNDFVNQRAVKFEHCYPAGSIVGKGFWKKNDNNELVIDDKFEKALQRLRSYEDSGLINNTTVRDLIGYWLNCENIQIEYTDSATVEISNKNNKKVPGISFAVSAKKLSSTKIIHQKFFQGDLIFWMDLEANEKVTVTFSN
jgi:hypothetical protein